jgi:SAM-dependent methyltransferase
MQIQSIAPWLRANLSHFIVTDPLPALIEWFDYRCTLSFHPNGRLVDLGGGVSALNGFLSKLGMEVWVVDLLENYYEHSSVTEPITPQRLLLQDMGVRFINADLCEFDLRSRFDENSLDAVVTYHAMEHLHHSPRRLLESAVACLKPNGRLIIEVPNAANLIKRLKVGLGRTNYLPFSNFYEHDRWCGHIREYTLGDLRELAQRLKLSPWRIEGRNWYGSLYRSKYLAHVAKLIDHALRVRPGLCGSLFLIGHK